MKFLTLSILFSAFSFLFFGWACLFTAQMKSEFSRYGLASFRRIVGVLQLLGGLGLLIGNLNLPLLQLIAATGLCVLMFLGFLIRVKIKDSFLQAVPSLSYALLNAYIFYCLLQLYMEHS